MSRITSLRVRYRLAHDTLYYECTNRHQLDAREERAGYKEAPFPYLCITASLLLGVSTL